MLRSIFISSILILSACSTPSTASVQPAVASIQKSAPTQADLSVAQTPAVQTLPTETQIAPTLPPSPPSPSPTTSTATAVHAAPNAPQDVSISCSSVDTSHKAGKIYIHSARWTVKLTWKDNSNDEAGFYVYKDGSLAANLGPTTTSYTELVDVMQIQVGAPATHNFGVVAFNQYGKSPTRSFDLNSCP